MATQEYIDDLIIVIETAEDAESVTNQMVAAVLDFLNEHLKLVSQGKEIEAEEAARIAADAALQKAIDAVSLRIDRLVGIVVRGPDMNMQIGGFHDPQMRLPRLRAR